jgi:hypothetical protein
MKQLAIATTEAGTLCLFDPAALPDDIRANAYASNLDYLQALSRRGALHLVATGGEGRFLLHVYVDEPMPVDLAERAVERSMLAAFPAPSGRVVVAGAEELSPDVATRLSRPPAPGPTIEIPPGMYAVTLYRTAFEDDLRTARLAEHVGSAYAWVLRNLGWFVVPVAASAVLTILSFFLFSLWLEAVLPFLVFSRCCSRWLPSCRVCGVPAGRSRCFRRTILRLSRYSGVSISWESRPARLQMLVPIWEYGTSVRINERQ